MSEENQFTAILCGTVVLLAWSVAWGIVTYQQSMAKAGLVPTPVPHYTTEWTAPGIKP